MKNKNQLMVDKLDAMNLSDNAKTMLEQTDINIFAELFQGMEKEQIERLADEWVRVSSKI